MKECQQELQGKWPRAEAEEATVVSFLWCLEHLRGWVLRLPKSNLFIPGTCITIQECMQTAHAFDRQYFWVPIIPLVLESDSASASARPHPEVEGRWDGRAGSKGKYPAFSEQYSCFQVPSGLGSPLPCHFFFLMFPSVYRMSGLWFILYVHFWLTNIIVS